MIPTSPPPLRGCPRHLPHLLIGCFEGHLTSGSIERGSTASVPVWGGNTQSKLSESEPKCLLFLFPLDTLIPQFFMSVALKPRWCR